MNPSQPTTNAPTLRLSRRFRATRQQVYDAWTNPSLLVQWWGPETMSTPLCEMDVREGGRYRTTMRSPEGKDFTVGGTYLSLRPPEHIRMSWAWEQDGQPGTEMIIVVDLIEHGDETELILTQTQFADDESCSKHKEGWESSFNSLGRFLES